MANVIGIGLLLIALLTYFILVKQYGIDFNLDAIGNVLAKNDTLYVIMLILFGLSSGINSLMIGIIYGKTQNSRFKNFTKLEKICSLIGALIIAGDLAITQSLNVTIFLVIMGIFGIFIGIRDEK